jgi:hypothetical protein
MMEKERLKAEKQRTAVNETAGKDQPVYT